MKRARTCSSITPQSPATASSRSPKAQRSPTRPSRVPTRPCLEGYDWRMCSHQEWESLRRRFQEAVDEGELREFVDDAVARVEAFVEELKSRAFAPEDDYWVRGCGRRSRTEWVA